MVWAAAFALALADDLHEAVAYRRAATAVLSMRGSVDTTYRLVGDTPEFVAESAAMLNDMLSMGGDR